MILLEAPIPSTTDWIQAVGSLFAVAGLIYTLYQQNKTSNEHSNTLELQRQMLDDQKTLLKLESEKDRRYIKPFFKVKPHYWDVGSSYIEYGFTVFLERNDAHFVGVFIIEPNSARIDFTADLYDLWEVGTERTFKTLHPVKFDNQFPVMEIKFRDEDGRFYHQFVNLVFDKFQISLPELDTQKKPD